MLQPQIYQAASLRLRSPPYGASSFFSIHGKFRNRTETVHSISNLAAATYNTSKTLQLSTSRSSRPAAPPAAMASTTTAGTDAKPAPAPAGGPQLKLLVDRRSRRVLYAEARKDAVDFLIGLLRVPAGLAARALAKHGETAPGSLGSLYAGALALDDAFFVSGSPNRDALLSPAPALPSAALPLLLGDDGAAPTPPTAPVPPPPPQRFFRCGGSYGTSCRGNPTTVTDVSGLPCPVCRQPMTVEMRLAPGDAHGKLALAQAQAQEAAGLGAGGYVKELVTYLVMDDLTVAPMSTISAIMLLKKFDVKDCSALEEMTVELGTKEAVMLLKASLQSSTALTDVFSGGVSIDRIGG